MDDALLVRLLESLGDLAGDGKAFIYGKTPVGQPLGQGRPVDQLHHQRTTAVGALLDAVDLRDVRVVQAGEELRLALEAGEPLRIGGEPFGQDLERDLAP